MKRLAPIAFTFLTLVSRQAMADDTTSPASTSDKGGAAAAPVKAENTDAKSADAKSEGDAKDSSSSVFLHVGSPAQVRVERDGTNEVVCTSPCDQKVPASATYHIGGARPSPSFVLAASNGRADVKVKPGSKTSFWTGVGALGLGGALVAGGVSTLVYGFVNRAPVQGGEGTETDNTYTDFMIAGTGLVLVGVCSGIWGAATVMANASTSVRGNLNTAVRNDAPNRAQQVGGVAGGVPRASFVSVLGGTF